MMKLRKKILSTILLAAMCLTMVGTTAEAARRSARAPSVTPPRPVARPLSGEPDLTGQTAPAPPKIDRTSMQPALEDGEASFRVWVRIWLSQFLKRRI